MKFWMERSKKKKYIYEKTKNLAHGVTCYWRFNTYSAYCIFIRINDIVAKVELEH